MASDQELARQWADELRLNRERGCAFTEEQFDDLAALLERLAEGETEWRAYDIHSDRRWDRVIAQWVGPLPAVFSYRDVESRHVGEWNKVEE